MTIGRWRACDDDFFFAQWFLQVRRKATKAKQLQFLQQKRLCYMRLALAQGLFLSSIRTRVKVHAVALHHPAFSAAAKLLRCDDEPSWISLCGFTKELFYEIHDVFAPFFTESWEKHYEHEVNAMQPRGRPGALYNRHSGDCRLALLLILMFFTTCTQEKIFCQLFGAAPTTTNKYLHIALRALRRAMLRMRDAHVVWPDDVKLLEYSKMIVDKQLWCRRDMLPFAFIDGLNLSVMESGDFFEQNQDYSGWLSETVCSNLLVYAPDGTVIHATINAPGTSIIHT